MSHAAFQPKPKPLIAREHWYPVCDYELPAHPILVLSHVNMAYATGTLFPLAAKQYFERNEKYPWVSKKRNSTIYDWVDGYGRAIHNPITHFRAIPLWDAVNNKPLPGWHPIEEEMPFSTPVLVIAPQADFGFPLVVRRFFYCTRGWQKDAQGKIIELLDTYDREMEGVVTHWLELPSWDSTRGWPIHDELSYEEAEQIRKKALGAG